MLQLLFFSQLNDLSERRMEEAIRLKEINHKEEDAKDLARQEKERCEAAIMEAECMRECAEREASQRRAAEIKAMRDAKEKEKLENAIVGPMQQYQEITWEEIVSATLSFSEDLRIGMGAYGTVYKCNLHHTTAAVKVLHSKENNNTKQFQQEVWKCSLAIYSFSKLCQSHFWIHFHIVTCRTGQFSFLCQMSFKFCSAINALE